MLPSLIISIQTKIDIAAERSEFLIELINKFGRIFIASKFDLGPPRWSNTRSNVTIWYWIESKMATDTFRAKHWWDGRESFDSRIHTQVPKSMEFPIINRWAFIIKVERFSNFVVVIRDISRSIKNESMTSCEVQSRIQIKNSNNSS